MALRKQNIASFVGSLLLLTAGYFAAKLCHEADKGIMEDWFGTMAIAATMAGVMLGLAGFAGLAE